MAKWSIQTELGKITDVPTFMRFCSQAVQDLQAIFNGRIDFATNITNQIVDVTFSQANVDTRVDHTLNKTVNFFVVNKGISCDVYRGSNGSNGTIYLRCTQPTTVSVMLF